MKDIFTGIFSKVFGFFSKAEKQDESAKDVAVNRLRVVLMQDRTNLTPELLEKMRGELIELLSKYVEMDKEALELNFEQEGDQMALMLSIPVLRAKEEDEIEAEENEDDENSEEVDDDTEDETDESEENEDDDEQVSEEKNSNTK
ncbi:cell division topological specificity factor MinE [bacterium]|nr:cell division topological specificity factor MinE [bacterium]